MKNIIIYLLLVLASYSHAQKGEYFIKNYSPKEYGSGANNSGICQDNNGNIFVANANGILIFDGINWTLNPSKYEAFVYSIFKSSDNNIYYASGEGETNDFGIFEQQEKGQYIYHSLLNKLSDIERPTEPIRQILESNNAIYFLSSDKIIEYKNKKFKCFSPSNAFNARALKMGRHLFFIDLDNQVFVLEDGILKPVKNSQEAAANKAFFCYNLSDKNYAIGYRDVGIFLANYDSNNPTNTLFKKHKADCDNELIDCEVNNGTILKDGNFVFTSNKNGAFIIDKGLKVIKQLNTKAGLFENNIKAAFEDQNGNLWLPNYYGVSYVEINTLLLKYGRENGISGSVQTACYYKNNLYIGTDKGLHVFDQISSTFIDVLEFNKQTWFLLNHNDVLIVCTAKGMFMFNGKEIKQINEESTRYLLNDPYQPDVIYAATSYGFNVYHVSGSEFALIKEYNLGNEVKNIASDYNKNIYFSTEFNGIYYLNYKNSYLLDSIKKQNGLPNDKWENYVFNYNNRLLIGTEAGIYAVSESKSKRFFCKKDPTFFSYTKNAEIFRAVELNGDLLCSQNVKSDENETYETKYVYFKNTDNKITEDNKGIRNLKGVKPNLINYDSINKIVLISADEGLFLLHQQNSLTNKKYDFNLSSLMNKKSDTVLLHKNNKINFDAYKIEVPFSENNLFFKFGYNCFEIPESTDFCYFLEGKDDEYGKWGKKAEVEYSNLFEGFYTLHIKARNDISNEILEMHIPFTILAPWYRSVTAYIIYTIMFVLFSYFLVKLNTKRLVAQNIKLEEIITQRTAIIEEQVHLLEHQKQEITDSINYAQRIQESILPSFKEINETYSNGFIFFQPKDIVSGDFYWFKKTNNNEFLLACADCTGHGVPGAFMSMICSEKLSEAVLFSTRPDKILFHANNAIKEVLKQNQQDEGKSKDGMEISLIQFNIITKKISYAGANRPLWLIKHHNKELIEVKPTKASIASFTDFNFEYEQHDFILDTNDTVYLTSDGFPDQFGGSDGRKFMTKNMKTFLIEISDFPMDEQKQMVSSKINTWMGNLEQVDDLLVIGLKA